MSGRSVTRTLFPFLIAALVTISATAQVTPAPPAEPKREAPARAATQAPAVEHDLTTPKGALKHLAAALRDGDAERIRRVMYATTPSEARMVAAMADMAKAMALLQKAAVKAFGEEG